MIAYTLYMGDTRVRREAETLAELEDYTVFILVPKEYDLLRSYILDKVHVKELNIRQYRGKSQLRYILSYCRFILIAFMSITGRFLRGKLDIVHVHNMPNFLVYVAMIPRLFGKKVILDVHDTVPETYLAKFDKKENLVYHLLRLEESLSTSFASKIICVNHVQRDALVKRGVPEDKITVSMNVPDHKRFNSKLINEEVVEKNSSFKLVFHGTITKRLGIDLAILAVAMLVDKIPDLKFYIIGGGDDAEEYIRISKDLGVEKQVQFSDFIPVESLVPALKGMDLGIVSNRENIATELMLPVKMLEYIRMDIPVIAPKLKTIKYYFTDDMVSYFEPGDIGSLADAIFKLYKDKSKREIQVKNARKFLDKYGWENHKMGLINLYKGL